MNAGSVLRRRAAIAVPAAIAALTLAYAPVAAAAPAPSKAVQIASAAARAHFHTTHLHVTTSLLSRRDPRWALVDGFATARNRLWAAWLHGDARGHWELRYFDTTAPLQPQSTKHGRVPCDLYPAFSEPLCHPGPTPAQIKAGMYQQLRPSGATAKIGTLLRNGGYSFMFKPLLNGTMMIAWYQVPKGAHVSAAAPKPTLIARGSTDFNSLRAAKITIRLTAAGRRVLAHASSVKLTAKGTFTPILYGAVSTTRTFALTR